MAEIKVNDGQNIYFDGKSHPIDFTDNKIRVNNGEYNISLYRFTDEKGIEADGCVFEIVPRGSTRVMRITNENLNCERIAIRGSGWFLGVSPEGEVVSYELDSEVEENPCIEIGVGWVDCLIAGDNKEGIEVLDISSPPFDVEMEEEVPFEDSSLPAEFWKKYKELKNLE